MNMMVKPPAVDLLVVELREQIAELRTRLAIAQEDLIEMARDAGQAQGEIDTLKVHLDDLRRDRDAWREQAERRAG